ncbi:MAG TPA: NAD(P)-dependent alcohol dehydrogenase [Phenylobacterium sp.]|nr:NAD(P)-dependent alcohol dehydrogenase [Phenylobacterium sp.]
MRERGGPFSVEPATLDAPRRDEVLVRIVATGMCHTDLAMRNRPPPAPMPIVLGHEGAGVVEAVGEAVTAVEVGDHVVLSFLSCGVCPSCQSGSPFACASVAPLNLGGARPDGSHALHDAHGVALHDRFFGQSSFATYAIAHERNLVRVRKDAPLELLGPLGCGVLTGAGCVFNSLKVGPGDTLAVFGAGAVGLSAVMAARVAGAAQILVVDRVADRLALALELGATQVFDSAENDPVAAIIAATHGGVRYAIDTTAVPSVVSQMVAALAMRGTAAIVGVSPPGTMLSLDTNDLMVRQKTIRGVLEGDAVPQLLIPILVDLIMAGRFPLERLVGFFELDGINEAAESSRAGNVVKPIIRMAGAG